MSLNILDKPTIITGGSASVLSKILSFHLHISTLFTVTSIHEYAWRFHNGHYSLINNLSSLIPMLAMSAVCISLYIVTKRIS